MAAAGATVAIGDTNIDDGQRTVAEILSAGGKASFRSCDVAEAEQVTALVNRAVADFGQLDVLVNDAGICWSAPHVCPAGSTGGLLRL